MNNAVDQTQGKGLSHGDYTPTPCPGSGPWARDVVSLLGAPVPLLKGMCGTDLKGEQERKVGGRRQGQVLLPPCLSQCFANMRSLRCPQEAKHPPARAQGWMRVGAGIAAQCGQPWAHNPDRVLLSVPLPPAVPSRTPPRATPQGSPPNWGHPPALSRPWGADGRHPAGTTAWRTTASSSRPSLPSRHTWEKTDAQCARTHSQNQPQIWIGIREN